MGQGCCEPKPSIAGSWSVGPSHGRLAASGPLPIRRQDAYAFAHRRRKLWELSGVFHCSIIGTCLSTGELRKLLIKLHPPHARESDHTLHGVAVGLAERHDAAGKVLQKALDARHTVAINRCARARTTEAVREFWAEARAAGDIPGPYWAVMTHSDASPELQREVFGEVHMLSHLVGAANRADIRRLAQLEAENVALATQVARQQARLQDLAAERDVVIQELHQRPQKPDRRSAAQRCDAEVQVELEHVRRRLDSEVGHRLTLERRLEEMRACLDAEQRAGAEAMAQVETLRAEIVALEETLAPGEAGDARIRLDLRGMTLLYVGGRPNQSARLRRIAEDAGAVLLLHDGGVEDAEAQLAGFASRADVALFPVDCVSHDAALAVKRHCRRLGKPFIPLRGTGGAAFLAALHGLAAAPENTS